MKKIVYDTTKLSECIGDLLSFSYLKRMMLEAIGNIAVAVKDKDAARAMEIQSNLMWVYEVLGTIKAKEVEQ